VTFEVHWRHVLKTQHVRDATVGFEGNFKQTDAHIEWSMRNATGFRFESNSSNQTTLTALSAASETACSSIEARERWCEAAAAGYVRAPATA